jgi:DNA repair protein RadC
MEKSKFWTDLKSGRFASMVKESSKGKYLSSSDEVFNVMKPMFPDAQDIETMYCIFLDTKNRVIGIEKVSEGTINHAAVYPREIVKRLIANKATAAVLVHNHPSGDPAPSAEDKQLTVKVIIALFSIDAHLHDHVIVGDTYHSMTDAGFVKSIINRVNNLSVGNL